MKKLVVVLAPETFDRGTERPFVTLFSGTNFITSPHWMAKIAHPLHKNPELDENCVLMFEGGTDVNPKYYGEMRSPQTQKPDEVRDRFEKELFEKAVKLGVPIIGICRGAQLACVLSGGKLIQHTVGHGNGRHSMQLPQCFGGRFIEVTSAHHQMMFPYNLPKEEWKSLGFCPYPRSSDKYFGETGKRLKVEKKIKDFKEQEIIWFPKTKALAIQGHPEYITNPYHPFITYCRFLIRTLILGEKTQYDVFAS